jgi:hypothetical protein
MGRKYFPQHLLLKHILSMFFALRWETKSHSHIKRLLCEWATNWEMHWWFLIQYNVQWAEVRIRTQINHHIQCCLWITLCSNIPSYCRSYFQQWYQQSVLLYVTVYIFHNALFRRRTEYFNISFHILVHNKKWSYSNRSTDFGIYFVISGISLRDRLNSNPTHCVANDGTQKYNGIL